MMLSAVEMRALSWNAVMEDLVITTAFTAKIL